MQGLVNTLADLRGAFSAAERINSVIKTGRVDESLARGLELDITEEIRKRNGAVETKSRAELLTMSAANLQTPTRSLKDLAWAGDASLEGKSCTASPLHNSLIRPALRGCLTLQKMTKESIISTQQFSNLASFQRMACFAEDA